MIGLILGLIFLGVCSPIVCAYRPRVDKLDIILPESPKISLKDLESHRDGTIWLAILGHVWDVSMGSKVRNAKNYENIDELPSNRGRYSSAGGVGGMSPLPGEMPTAPQFRSLMQFYGPGGSYEFFAGKDASRAYATGNFTDDLTDDLTGLSSEKLLSIVEWLAFYAESDYEHIGVLAGGAFFDDSGRQTDAYGAVFAAARALQEDEQKFLSSPDMANPHCTSRQVSSQAKGLSSRSVVCA